MKRHKFNLVLAGASELTPELADALYDAVNGDIECEQRDGVISLEITRSAESIRSAIMTAIRDVEEARPGLRVVRVESDIASTIAEINAALLGAD